MKNWFTKKNKTKKEEILTAAKNAHYKSWAWFIAAGLLGIVTTALTIIALAANLTNKLSSKLSEYSQSAMIESYYNSQDAEREAERILRENKDNPEFQAELKNLKSKLAEEEVAQAA